MIRAGLRRLFLAAALVALPAASCGQGTCTFPPVRQSPVDGVVTEVSATGLTAVQGFTIRQSDGSIVGFTMGTLDDPTVFSPGHLKAHETSATPVRVWFKVQNGRELVVYHLEDAPATPAADATAISFSCP
jgi:hypothetical protein